METVETDHSTHDPKMPAGNSPILLLLPLFLTASAAAAASLPSDTIALLSFKSAADLDHKLLYSITDRFDHCQWQGVKCAQGRVVRLSLPGAALRGVFPPDTLSRLDQLRILSLQNNSLYGPVPDLSALVNLKSLFLGHNGFSGAFPPSILSLRYLRVLDLRFDNFSGPIPDQIISLDRLETLRLEFNRFTGPLPPLNQILLRTFNVSGNNLTGIIPATPALSRFGASSYLKNPGLCGAKVNRPCSSGEPFFGGSGAVPEQSTQSQGAVVVVNTSPPPASHLKKPKRTGVIVGFTMGVVLLVAAGFIVSSLIRARGGGGGEAEVNPKEPAAPAAGEAAESPPVVSKTVELVIEEPQRVNRSGYLIFCAGEAELYSLEQLMRASAELLGRGTMGTTYKAVLDNHLIVTVKRLDSSKTVAIGEEAFERHMDAVGGLRHPNLVPLRAHFQAQGERLVIFDYQPNGSLHNLIHGSKTARAKPLHWTSCLKIADDVAQGLAYLHESSRLIHGNIKSSNILLGTEFEACLTDYCLSILLTDNSPTYDDPDSAAYRAPEARKSWRRATTKSDVYAFGVLLLELLTGKHPSQHPFVALPELPEWVRAVREDDGSEDGRLEMLVEVAGVCRLSSPEQRPAMRQVVKMVNEIKESVVGEDGSN